MFEQWKTIFKIRKIVKRGQTLPLSRSEIIMYLVNLYEAKKNLSEGDFNRVYSLYQKYRDDHIESYMDKNLYFKTSLAMINQMNEIAPFEEYRGR